MSKKLILSLLFIIAISCFLSACGENRQLRKLQEADLKLKITVSKSKKAYPMDSFNAPPSLIYHASNNIHLPFDNIGGPVHRINEVTSPLQMYPLDTLWYVGQATQNHQIIAYIMSPDGNLHQVKIGDAIGDQYGKILNIYSDRIEVVEEHTNGMKSAARRIITLQLKGES